jgi:glycosyltransferase involved in cell wall biosynthesis
VTETAEVAVVGLSVSSTCGVRDHARLLATALERQGVRCTFHWLTRRERSLRSSRTEIRAWTRELASELHRSRPDAVLLHYSVFSYSHKGLPLFVAPTLSALRDAGVPVVVVLHEFAYPWRLGGWRGKVWAFTQRAALIGVMRAATSALVTADSRVGWLETRPWLPRRGILLAPVFSNLPPPSVMPSDGRDGAVVGLFGYSYQGAALSLILDALGRLAAGGAAVTLRLLGGPGGASQAGAGWLAEARRRGLAELLSFTGPLEAQRLSDALAACDVLLFADTAGPSSRKGSLAGSLASGRPVVAIDGPQTWSRLLDADAVRVVAPTADSLAGGIAALLEDTRERDALGARGREFAAREMGLERTVQVVMRLLDDALEARRA